MSGESEGEIMAEVPAGHDFFVTIIEYAAIGIGLLGNGGIGMYMRKHAIRQAEHQKDIENIQSAIAENYEARRECQGAIREQMSSNERIRLSTEKELFDLLRANTAATADTKTAVAELKGMLQTFMDFSKKGKSI